jgi:hypothetical protein
MAQQTRVAKKIKVATQKYYVADPRLKTISGTNVVEQGDDRTVLLSAADAQYYLDQGVISRAPLDAQSSAALRQMSGVRD